MFGILYVNTIDLPLNVVIIVVRFKYITGMY